MKKSGAEFFVSPFIRIFIPMGLAYFMSIMLGSANAIMSRILVEEFSLSPSGLGFVSSIFLIVFGFMQFPLGIMLDRNGPAKTMFPLLMAAAAGCFVLSRSEGLAGLVVSRVLMGGGLSGCLMASYKAYADWIPAGRLPVAYSLQNLMGGIGGIVATRPLAMLFGVIEWRGLFAIFAAALAALAVFVRIAVPQKNYGQVERMSFARQLGAMIGFLADVRFWRIAPVLMATQGVLFTYLYLWLGPWMRDVAAFGEGAVGFYLMAASVGSAAGYFFNGILADWFRKKRIMSWENMYLGSGLTLTVALAAIGAVNSGRAAPLWVFVLFLSTMTMIAFPLMRMEFDDGEVGRVLSLLNFSVFFISFPLQWMAGVMLEFYPSSDGHFSPLGYRNGIASLVLINAAATLHLYYCLRKRKAAKIGSTFHYDE
jgi:MFS family permease